MTKTESNYIERLRDLTTNAETHLQAAEAAHDAGDHGALRSAHRSCAGVLRAMHRVFKSMSDDGTLVNTDMKVAGTDGGTSSPPRTGSPLMHGDLKGWLDRARQGSRR